tara:strand:- start:6763 stop:7176 length:414 start_codon:yes stop_codon:yes gene_type:complete
MSYLADVNNNKYLYFRNAATDADDDGTGDSALFPASSLMGMEPGSDTRLTLYFKSMTRRDPTGSVDSANSLDNHDTVGLTIGENRHLEAMEDIINAITSNGPSLIVIANNDSGGTEYISAAISACGTISVAAAYANS